MADILLLQDTDPPFRLAAWVLREGGHRIRVLASADEALSELSIEPPGVAVLNIGGSLEDQRHAVAVLRAVTRQAPLLHVTDSGHETSDCECDGFLEPPYTGPALLDQVRRLSLRT